MTKLVTALSCAGGALIGYLLAVEEYGFAAALFVLAAAASITRVVLIERKERRQTHQVVRITVPYGRRLSDFQTVVDAMYSQATTKIVQHGDVESTTFETWEAR